MILGTLKMILIGDVMSGTMIFGRKIEIIGHTRSLLGEGPVWDQIHERLLWLDIKGRRLRSYIPRSGITRFWALPFRVGSISPSVVPWTAPNSAAEAAYLCCGDEGFGWLFLDGDEVEFHRIVHPEVECAGNRFNDGKLGPDGRYWAGTMDDAELEASGALYAFASDGSWQRLDDGYRVTNGPAFSVDGRTVYHSDSALQTIYAFDLGATGTLTNKRVFALFGEGDGYPDGMTIDRSGNLWVAFWDGWRIEKLAADGRRIGHIEMPVPLCTSCCFAGDDETALYVTSANIGLPSDDAISGALFRVIL